MINELFPESFSLCLQEQSSRGGGADQFYNHPTKYWGNEEKSRKNMNIFYLYKQYIFTCSDMIHWNEVQASEYCPIFTNNIY